MKVGTISSKAKIGKESDVQVSDKTMQDMAGLNTLSAFAIKERALLKEEEEKECTFSPEFVTKKRRTNSAVFTKGDLKPNGYDKVVQRMKRHH